MEKEQMITKVTVEYRNDADAMNKLIDLIIHLLLDNNLAAGEEFGEGEKNLQHGRISELPTKQ